MPAPETLRGRRVVADPAAIATGWFPPAVVLIRIAPDEVLAVGEGSIELSDDHAVVEEDSGWCALRLDEDAALAILAAHAAWEPGPARPTLAQGMLAGLAAKVYLDGPRSMLIVAAPFAAELEARLV